jgi:hypothetical protein
MTNRRNNESQDWPELLNNELNSHKRFIERSLIQMRLRYRYSPDSIISQIFIDFHEKVRTGRIKHEYDFDDSLIYFVSQDKNGNWRRIISINAYLRMTIMNCLRKLYALEKKGEVLVDSDTLEHLDLLMNGVVDLNGF